MSKRSDEKNGGSLMRDCDCKNSGEEISYTGTLDAKKIDDSFKLAELFKVFGDPTRIKILLSLQISERCVCDIATFLQMTPSAISHQLRVLKQAKLVKNRREGKGIFYSLDDHHIELILKVGLDHIHEE